MPRWTAPAALLLLAIFAAAQQADIVNLDQLTNFMKGAAKGGAMFAKGVQVAIPVIAIARAAYILISGQGIAFALNDRWFLLLLTFSVVIAVIHVAYAVSPLFKQWIDAVKSQADNECPLIVCPGGGQAAQ